MGEHDDLAALVGDFGDRRSDALDARRVGHAAVLSGNIEVDSQEDALAGDIDVVERAEWFAHGQRRAGADPGRPMVLGSKAEAQMSFASATAVSAMRCEKPHSLSYQDRTRTKVPSMTLVWSRWKTEERSSWLKSIETFGLSVKPRMPFNGPFAAFFTASLIS